MNVEKHKLSMYLMCFHSKWWIPVESYRPSLETKHGMSFDTAQKIASAAEKQAHVSGEFQWRCYPGTSINKCKPFLEKIHGKIMSCSLRGLNIAGASASTIGAAFRSGLLVCVCITLTTRTTRRRTMTTTSTIRIIRTRTSTTETTMRRMKTSQA